VRQAIAHCISREAICKVVFFGNAVPSAAPVVPYHKDFHSEKPSPYPFDVAAAAKLLDEAGYRARERGALQPDAGLYDRDQRYSVSFCGRR